MIANGEFSIEYSDELNTYNESLSELFDEKASLYSYIKSKELYNLNFKKLLYHYNMYYIITAIIKR